MFLKEEYLIDEHRLDGQSFGSLLVAMDILFFNVLSIGWYLGTIVIYAFFLYSIGKLNEVYFNSYGGLSFGETMPKNFTSYFRSMRIVWHTIATIKEQFDDVFSIQPFLWFVCLFIECSLTLILFKYEYVQYAQQSLATIFIDNWSLYFLRALFVFGVTFIVEHVNSKATRMSRTFLNMLLENYHRKEARLEVSALILEIKSNLTIKLTCWGTFRLNKTAILMFVNSVIPFSVLVLELTETIIKSRPKNS